MCYNEREMLTSRIFRLLARLSSKLARKSRTISFAMMNKLPPIALRHQTGSMASGAGTASLKPMPAHLSQLETGLRLLLFFPKAEDQTSSRCKPKKSRSQAEEV